MSRRGTTRVERGPRLPRQAFAADLERLFGELEQMEPELMVVAGGGGEAAAASVLLDDSRVNRLILQARPVPRPLRLPRRRCAAPGRAAVLEGFCLDLRHVCVNLLVVSMAWSCAWTLGHQLPWWEQPLTGLERW
jgi:hypothetical protein